MLGFVHFATTVLLAVQFPEGGCPASPFLSLNSAPACSLPAPQPVTAPWSGLPGPWTLSTCNYGDWAWGRHLGIRLLGQLQVWKGAGDQPM